MNRLSKLEVLNINSNEIKALPETATFSSLKTLEASNNFIRVLPLSMVYCKNIESLILEGNPLQASFWSFIAVAQFPKLTEL